MNRYTKYPRTPKIFPWQTDLDDVDDDVIMSSDAAKRLFDGHREIVVTVKMDGENTTMYNDHIHARSLDSIDHPSRHFVKGLHAGIKYLIPDGVRVCGENLFAHHTLFYDDLLSYFMVFNVWHGPTCVSWESVVAFANNTGLQTVPVLYIGPMTVDDVWKWIDYIEQTDHEGIVFRDAGTFQYDEFGDNVVKYVKKSFRQQMEDSHWLSKPVTPNKLRE